MEFRCSPYNSLLFFGFIGMLFFAHPRIAHGQCNTDFSYQSFSADADLFSGKIEITKAVPEQGRYTFKVFKVEAGITLVKSGEVSSSDKIVIDRLSPGNYLVKIEWGTGCYRTVGGLDGILITRKEQ